VNRRYLGLKVGIAVVVALGIGAVLYPVSTCGGHPSDLTQCLSRVRGAGLALSMYVADTDDRFPPADHWNEAIGPYSPKSEPDFLHCPAGGTGARYGYAMHRSLSLARLTSIEDLAARLAIFESVVCRANAVGDESYLPRPGRHDGVNIVGYVDGHAKRIRNE
jgi:prepilin-type processing-associated H-X9-DG protein